MKGGDVNEERAKLPKLTTDQARVNILSGMYPTKIVKGRQRKHEVGTQEFKDAWARMNAMYPGSKTRDFNRERGDAG